MKERRGAEKRGGIGLACLWSSFYLKIWAIISQPKQKLRENQERESATMKEKIEKKEESERQRKMKGKTERKGRERWESEGKRIKKGERKVFWHWVNVWVCNFVWKSNASTIKIDTTLCHNLPYGESWLVKVCPHMTHWHTFTNHNSPCGELWYKVVPILIVLALLSLKLSFFKWKLHTKMVTKHKSEMRWRKIEIKIWELN